MKILVDADACPVKEIIVYLAKKYDVSVEMVTDSAHVLYYAEPFVHVTTVDKGSDSADLKIANLTQKGDVAVTGDYGLATLLLAKGATTLHHNGFFYTPENIDRMLFERHLSREMRRQKKGRSGRIAKRTKENDEAFQNALERVLQQEK
ncbi:YaiI/YqxD family protein [Chakrabartyella piscis]|uniref:YaiI/YqxD family protein n=1 Tax=Chakrabartyella piscis TaxID=2918914 RepID=UPI00295883B0|nr:YaiI/YqxD family protein [Chakrabartyella piscis]